MRNYIIGTSGHIDHGKTSLVKALTGIDTDRLKEEKEKGISIDIGFSFVDFDEYRVGVIDIPGHEKFIKNMLAGASGVDICLFIVAADDGIMPQTQEHFDILNLLGVKHGIIVLNKCDRVDEETIALRREELQEFVIGSFLEDSPIVETSIYDEDSINNLKVEVSNCLKNIEETQINQNIFRMPIDRAFTLNGIGQVITGTTIGKNVNVNDKLEILPQKTLVTVKNIQNHGEDKSTLESNNRCALNITFNEKITIVRGNTIATPNMLTATNRIDVNLKCLQTSKFTIKNNQRVRVYHLANEIMARVKLLDRDVIEKGEEGIAQLILEKPIIALDTDVIVVRQYSPLVTIGGGEIINVRAKKCKRYDEEYLNSILSTSSNDNDIVENLVLQNSSSYKTIEKLKPIFANVNDYAQIIENNNNITTINDIVLHKKYLKDLEENIAKHLKQFHQDNPFKVGEEIAKIRQIFFEDVKNNISNSLLKTMDFKILQTTISLPDFEVELNVEDAIVKKLIIKFYKRHDYKLQKVETIKADIKNKESFDNVFTLLVKDGTLVRIENDLFMLQETLDDIENYLNTLERIELNDLKDYTDSGRKNVIALLEYFDKQQITKRIDNYRIINK